MTMQAIRDDASRLLGDLEQLHKNAQLTLEEASLKRSLERFLGSQRPLTTLDMKRWREWASR
jgi:hypothetical protein